MSLKIKAKGKDAKELMEGKDSAHSAQRDLAAINGDGSRGTKYMEENPASRQAEGKDKSEVSDITKAVKKTMSVPTFEATPTQGFETVDPVNRTLPADYPERARRANNQARDMRTNLGRGKAGIVEVE